MYYAHNRFGKIIGINQADDAQDYYCKQCKRKLVIKGHCSTEIPGRRKRHFSHTPTKRGEEPCPETLEGGQYQENDMSDWHIAWQEKFPEYTREIWKKYNNEWARADVLIDESNTVIEFQHSHINVKEFDRRNRIYNGLGYTVIWLFDSDALWPEERGGPSYTGQEKGLQTYRFSAFRKQFGYFSPQNNKAVILCLSFREGLYHGEQEEMRKIVSSKWRYGNNTDIEVDVIRGISGFLALCKEFREKVEVKEGEEALAIPDWFVRYPKAKRVFVRNKLYKSKEYIVYRDALKYPEIKGVYIYNSPLHAPFVRIPYWDQPEWMLEKWD